MHAFMKTTLAVACVGGAFLLVTSGRLVAEGPVIRVHLVDGKTGKPVRHKPVEIVSIDVKKLSDPDAWSRYAERVKTDGTGVAVFHLPERPPKSVTIRIGMGGYWEQCGSPGYKIQEILDHGIEWSGPCPAGIAAGNQIKFEAQPGDVFLFTVHLTVWERMKYCNQFGCR
jgi:hypothetical protein